MGRKRKLRNPPITRSPKEVKIEESTIKEEPELIIEEYALEQPVQDQALSAVNSKGKPWAEKCEEWISKQQQVENSDAPPEASEEEDLSMEHQQRLMDDPAEPSIINEIPLRQRLKDYTEKEINNSVMYECEWLKCGFETNEDIVYLTHVEDHARRLVRASQEDEEFICHWDLCNFRTKDGEELEGHVHFHAYHNRLKTYGASLSNIIRVPKCNSDSRRRNSIEHLKTSFQCEWENCDEVFNKALPFFSHLNHHVQDQFPVDRKSSKVLLECQWSGCPRTYKRCSIALEHVRKHSQERSIGCYTCGGMFVSRLKYIDHCCRQVEYHNRVYHCPECDKLFATKQLVVDHRNIHNKKFACTFCPMRWPSRKALSYHIRYRHMEEKPFHCHICKHRTVTKSDLDEHVLTHDERRMFRCEEFDCDAAYKCQKSLKRHVDSVHYGNGPGIYECHQCPSRYKSGANLSKHLVKIHRHKRPPGYNRFMYRADHDGIFRLISVVTGEEGCTQDDHSTAQHKGNKKRKEKPATDDDENKDNANEPGTWTSFAIEELKPLGHNTFAIELKPDKEIPKLVIEKKPIKVKAEMKKKKDDEPTTSCSTTKNIDDFTVMKRYIKAEKPVEISYEETDSTGSVIRTKIIQTTELRADNLLQST